MHVKEIDLSKQSCVHNKKSRGFERASSPTWWQGGNGDCSYAVQPQHPGGSRWLPINPFHAFFPFPIVKLLVHTRELSCFICPGQAQIWTECHPGALSDRGGGGVAADCFYICFVTSARLDLHAFALSFSPGWFLLCLHFFSSSPPPPPSSSPFAERPSSWAATPPSPLLFHSQRLENLLKALPVFQVRKNFYEVSALFFH